MKKVNNISNNYENPCNCIYIRGLLNKHDYSLICDLVY